MATHSRILAWRAHGQRGHAHSQVKDGWGGATSGRRRGGRGRAAEGRRVVLGVCGGPPALQLSTVSGVQQSYSYICKYIYIWVSQVVVKNPLVGLKNASFQRLKKV